MKKFLLLSLSLFAISLFFVSKIVLAAPSDPPPSPSPSPSEEPAVNPGPPLGIPCGKTMCLSNEECVQYPGDVDQHCAPLQPPVCDATTCPAECGTCQYHDTVLECVRKAGGVCPSPTPTPLPHAPQPEKCSEGNGVFPPNSTCWNDIMNAQKDVKLYEKTCIYQPMVKYSDTRKYNTGKQPFTQCGKGDSPFGPGPGGFDEDCDVALLVNTDVKKAELGSYGPSTPAENAYSTDYLAQNFLYNALFGRPLDLSNSKDNNGEYPNREAYRTYWRLLPASNQANLRSFILNMANDKQIDNIHFEFTDTNGATKRTDFLTLYDHLKTQVILFWHFPFIRIGCLVQYPVCPEYALATQELIPDFQALRNQIRDLNLGPLEGPTNTALNLYESLISGPPFYGDLDGPYAAFVPLDFNSIPGYIVKKKDEKEQNTYDRFNDFKPLPVYHLTNVSFENIPYVGAIYQGLLSPKFGMLPALQPQWIIDKYATPSGLSDYKIGNTTADFPEVKIARRNFLEAVTEEATALITNPLGWIRDKLQSFFGTEDSKKGYTENGTNNTIDQVREVYDNPVGCPLPLSYHELAPSTAAQSIDDHHQVVTITGRQLAWFYHPACHDLCSMKGPKGQERLDCSCGGKGNYIQGDQCCEPQWDVEANKDGKALDVLNNPKQIDIKEAVSTNPQYSFYDMMLPDGAIKIPEAKIDAPVANHLFVDVRGGNSPKGEVKNPYEPINRLTNQAQDSIHYLQNCWTVPQVLQNSPRCSNVFTAAQEATSSSCPVTSDSAVDSKLLGAFKTNFISLADRWSAKCPGKENNKAEECYNYVASEAKKGGVNPAFALTIWLNESGASNYCQGGETTQDMGINLPSLYQNIVEQMKVFIRMANETLCDGDPGFVEPMHGWLSRFQSADGVCNAADPVATQYYYDVMNFTWSVVTGCPKNGRFGITWPTDMSCP